MQKRINRRKMPLNGSKAPWFRKYSSTGLTLLKPRSSSEQDTTRSGYGYTGLPARILLASYSGHLKGKKESHSVMASINAVRSKRTSAETRTPARGRMSLRCAFLSSRTVYRVRLRTSVSIRRVQSACFICSSETTSTFSAIGTSPFVISLTKVGSGS